MEREERRVQKPDKFSTQKGWSRFRLNGYVAVGDEALFHNSSKEQRAGRVDGKLCGQRHRRRATTMEAEAEHVLEFGERPGISAGAKAGASEQWLDIIGRRQALTL